MLLSGRILQRLACRPRVGVVPLLLIWLGLMVLGTRPIPRLLTRSIESSVQTYDPSRDAPLDLVVVLGGEPHKATGVRKPAAWGIAW